MPISEARRRANKKWNDANVALRYDRISVLVPNGQKETIQEAAESEGESLNGYIGKAILNRLGISEWPDKA